MTAATLTEIKFTMALALAFGDPSTNVFVPTTTQELAEAYVELERPTFAANVQALFEEAIGMVGKLPDLDLEVELGVGKRRGVPGVLMRFKTREKTNA